MVNIGQILSSMLMKRKHIAKSNADVARRIKMSDILISFYRRVVQIQCHGKKVLFFSGNRCLESWICFGYPKIGNGFQKLE
jgi:hypothetical protein